MLNRFARTAEGKLAIAAVLALAFGALVSIVTDDESWAWGVMILSGLAGIVLLGAAATVALVSLRRASRP